MKVEEGELKNSAGVGGAQEKEGEDLGGKSDKSKWSALKSYTWK